MIRRIALISPFGNFVSVGIRAISAYLRANGIQTRVIFLPGYDAIWKYFIQHEGDLTYSPRVLERVRELAADCDAVGITMMTQDKPKVESLINALAPLGKPIVLGGVHPTTFPEDAIELADVIVLGDGEEAMVEWCRAPERRDIENLWVKRDGEVFKNPVRPALANIDELPFPDYGPEDHWILYKKEVRPMTPQLLQRFMGGMYYQFATLGCPFSCTFCTNNRLKQLSGGYGKFRIHSADYIIEESKNIRRLVPGLRCIHFADDGFIAMKEEPMAAFAEQYEREVGLPFGVIGIIPTFLTEAKLDMLVGAGMKRVRLGLQSGCTATLRGYRRPGDAALYERCHNMLRKHRGLVFPYYDIIIDNPLIDAEEDMVETLCFLLGLKGRFTLFVYSLRMFPGTEIHGQAEERGLDPVQYEGSYFTYPNRLLNYIFTVIQCTSFKPAPRLLLGFYHRFGNLRVPRLLFSLNNALFVMRCGLEHVWKRDPSALPEFIVQPLAMLGYFRRGK